MWKHGSARDIKVIDPYVLGHECAGEIIAIGEKVSSSWKNGDRIAIKPGSPCLKYKARFARSIDYTESSLQDATTAQPVSPTYAPR